MMKIFPLFSFLGFETAYEKAEDYITKWQRLNELLTFISTFMTNYKTKVKNIRKNI
jgi:hypothetical protein